MDPQPEEATSTRSPFIPFPEDQQGRPSYPDIHEPSYWAEPWWNENRLRQQPELGEPRQRERTVRLPTTTKLKDNSHDSKEGEERERTIKIPRPSARFKSSVREEDDELRELQSMSSDTSSRKSQTLREESKCQEERCFASAHAWAEFCDYHRSTKISGSWGGIKMVNFDIFCGCNMAKAAGIMTIALVGIGVGYSFYIKRQK